MPGKSRHSKSKHPHYSKKSKAIHRQEAVAVQGPATDDMSRQPAVIEAPPLPKEKASPGKARVLQYPYISGELRRIGILAGIILVILIVLSIIIS